MKRIITASVALLASWNIYGQGTVNFANNSASAVTNILTGQRVPTGTTFRVSLYYLPDGPAPIREDQFILVLGTAGFSPVAGQFSAGSRTTPLTTAGGAPAYFMVKAWESAYGASYEEAKLNPVPQNGRLALVGTSNIIRVEQTGNPGVTPAANLTSFGLQGFTLVPVPEPTVLGLGIVGLGALLLLRRRK